MVIPIDNSIEMADITSKDLQIMNSIDNLQ